MDNNNKSGYNREHNEDEGIRYHEVWKGFGEHF